MQEDEGHESGSIHFPKVVLQLCQEVNGYLDHANYTV